MYTTGADLGFSERGSEHRGVSLMGADAVGILLLQHQNQAYYKIKEHI